MNDPQPSAPPKKKGWTAWFVSGLISVVGLGLAIVVGNVALLASHKADKYMVGLTIIAFLLYWFYKKSKPVPVEPTKQLSDEEKKRIASEQQLTELMLASADGLAEKVKSLILKGDDVNAMSNIGTTALMYAARNNHAQCIELLLKAGADKTMRTKGGSTAQFFAEKAEAWEALQALKN